MKNTLMLTVGACAAVATIMTGTTAQGRGAADSPRGALFAAENLNRLSVGAAFDMQDREMSFDQGGMIQFKSKSYYATLAFDVLDWLTVSGGIGQTEAKRGRTLGYDNGDTMWTTGVEANLWEHEVVAPTFMANTLRVQASYRYFDHQADMEGGTLSWTENRAAVTLNAEFFTRPAVDGSPGLPSSAVFYIGPAYSGIDGDFDVPGNGFSEQDDFGMVFGLDVKLAPNVSLGWQGRTFGGDLSHSATAVFHF